MDLGFNSWNVTRNFVKENQWNISYYVSNPSHATNKFESNKKLVKSIVAVTSASLKEEPEENLALKKIYPDFSHRIA